MTIPPRVPTILTNKSFPGKFASTNHGNIAWNEDGQCLIPWDKGVIIATPYLATSLPPPPSLIRANLDLELPAAAVNRAKRKARATQTQEQYAEDEDVDMDPTDGLPVIRIRRPTGGELKWYSTTINLEDNPIRQAAYGWEEAGDEYSALVMGKETSIKSAIWSPSNLSDLGGCLLVILTTSGQVSVYAPRSDPYMKPWDEIADLTYIAKTLLPSFPTGMALQTSEMLQLRATCVQWSPAISLPLAGSLDLSLLAITDKSGRLGLWSYAKKRCARLAYTKVTASWITHMAWSPVSSWRITGEDTCEALLAVAMTAGGVATLAIQLVIQQDTLEPLKVTMGPMKIMEGDRGRRGVTALTWVKNLVVYTKPATVHLWNANPASSNIEWTGTRIIRLERVGNWAGANGLGPCVGICSVGTDAILIVLNSLTHHLITDLRSNPGLAPMSDCLRPSMVTRGAFLDSVRLVSQEQTRYLMTFKSDRDITAHTGGYSAIGDWGSIMMWIAEPVTFHNLDSITEGRHMMDLVVADLALSLPQETMSVVESLQAILRHPPSLLLTSPLAVLLPYLLHILVSPDTNVFAASLLALCTHDENSTSDQSQPTDLLVGFWEDRDLDRLRLQLVLASFGMRTFASSRQAYRSAVQTLTAQIQQRVLVAILRWASAQARPSADVGPSQSQDDRLLGALFRSANTEDPMTAQLAEGLGMGRHRAIDQESCPACTEPIETESETEVSRCTRGHEWSRCSITNFLITTPKYRVCTSCPAISLLPTRYLKPPIPVTPEGLDTDYTRHVINPSMHDEPDWMVQTLLESARCCVICGGRWMRSI